MNDVLSKSGWVAAERRDSDPRWSAWITIGALLAALSVVAGALAAHGLDQYLLEQYPRWETRTVAGQSVPAVQKYLEDFNTAARYQMSHALGLMLIGLLATYRPSRLLSAAAAFHLLGIVLFCGSLYLLSLTAHSLARSAQLQLGLVAATGGTCLIVGWCVLAAAVCPCRRDSHSRDE